MAVTSMTRVFAASMFNVEINLRHCAILRDLSPVEFHLYIGTANVNRQWVRNVQKTPQVKLSIAGENFKGTARFLADRNEHEQDMAAIRRKYWMFRPIIELGRMLSGIGFMRDNTGSFEVTLTA